MSAENFVQTYVLLYSNEGSEWKSYTEGSSSMPKVSLAAQAMELFCCFEFNCLVLGAGHSHGSQAECPVKLIFSLDCKVLGSWGYYR